MDLKTFEDILCELSLIGFNLIGIIQKIINTISGVLFTIFFSLE